MHKLGALLLVVASARATIEIIQPTDLRDSLHSGNAPGGALEYSVSTFGHILYHEKTTVEVVFPGGSNINGCEAPSHPSDLVARKFVWLMERGVCTYSKKAFISQQSGAFAVLVYHDDPSVDIKNVIPCSDTICALSRQPREDSHHSDQQPRRAKAQDGAEQQRARAAVDRSRAGGLNRTRRRRRWRTSSTGCRRP